MRSGFEKQLALLNSNLKYEAKTYNLVLSYTPDFILKLRSGLDRVFELKGFIRHSSELAKIKAMGALALSDPSIDAFVVLVEGSVLKLGKRDVFRRVHKYPGVIPISVKLCSERVLAKVLSGSQASCSSYSRNQLQALSNKQVKEKNNG